MSNASSVVPTAVLAGAGIAVLPDYSVKKDIAEGRLVRLLPEGFEELSKKYRERKTIEGENPCHGFRN